MSATNVGNNIRIMNYDFLLQLAKTYFIHFVFGS